VSDHRRGFLLGIAAYVMWGLFPLYWPLLEPAGAVEILAHRIVWSLVTMLVITLVLRRTGQLRALMRNRRVASLLTVAAVVITFNWGGFIYGVNAHRVVEVSLGYFINPLVTVLLGVVVLGERLRRLQWVAIGLATLAVVVLTVDYGHPPWIAFLLAASFATYGLAKKKADVEAVESLTFETMVLTPVALGYLVWLAAQGSATFGSEGISHSLLLASTGLVTAVPLICFGMAANRLPLSTIGLMQYLTPVSQFLLGVLYFHERMPAERWAGFLLVWAALVLLTWDALRTGRRGRAALARAAGPAGPAGSAVTPSRPAR
jgi:chloramphenicol-sensitive protein RarD